MVLRRRDWETGDVICHECHLTAPHLPPSSSLPSASSSSSRKSPHRRRTLLNFLLFYLFHCLSVSPFLFSFHCNDLFEHIRLPLIFLHPPSRASLHRLTPCNITSLFQLLTLTAPHFLLTL